MSDFAGKAELEENRYVYEVLSALRLDFSAALAAAAERIGYPVMVRPSSRRLRHSRAPAWGSVIGLPKSASAEDTGWSLFSFSPCRPNRRR